MKILSKREEEIMKMLWANGPMFVKEIVEKFSNSSLHYNTLSTFVRLLEEKGMVAHEKFGTANRYYPLISQVEYSVSGVRNYISKFYKNSSKLLVSELLKEEDLSIDELKDLIKEVESQTKK